MGNVIPQDDEPIPSNKEIPTTGAIGILGGVSMNIPQIDVFQALLQTNLPSHLQYLHRGGRQM